MINCKHEMSTKLGDNKLQMLIAVERRPNKSGLIDLNNYAESLPTMDIHNLNNSARCYVNRRNQRFNVDNTKTKQEIKLRYFCGKLLYI